MANRIKKKTPPPPNPDKLTQDKEVEVTMQEIVKDERTYKIAGTISLLFSLFLFIAFTSYLFTWKVDQSQIFSSGGIRIFSTDEARVTNLLGVIGAYTSHFFIYKGFGIASFLFCTFFFVLGINLLFGQKVFSLKRNLKYVLLGLFVLSICLGYLFNNSGFSWGGAVGDFVSEWLVKVIGSFGTAVLLLVVAFTYFIWRFNPSFKWPERKQAIPSVVTEQEVLDTPSGMEINDLYKDEDDEEEGLLYIEKNVAVSNNKLKNDGKGVVVIMPQQDEPVKNALTDLSIVEKAEELAINTGIVPKAVKDDGLSLEIKEEHRDDDNIYEVPTLALHATQPANIVTPVTELPLEIKEFSEDIEEEEDELIPTPKPIKLDPYEPTLDLRDYKSPTLDLLETHGSEKIVHDPVELESNKNQIISTLKN